MLSPKKVKFRKQFTGKMKGKAQRGSDISFGEFGLKAMSCGNLTAQQLEAGRIAINRKIKRGGQMFIRVFPAKPITKKPAEVRQGKGKGSPVGYIAVVKPGKMIFEIKGIDRDTARAALRLAANKFPFPTKIISKEETI